MHLDFEGADAALAVDRAVRAGATLEAGLESYPWGQLARLCDPFGHGFCLLQMMAARGYARAG